MITKVECGGAYLQYWGEGAEYSEQLPAMVARFVRTCPHNLQTTIIIIIPLLSTVKYNKACVNRVCQKRET